MHMIKFSSYIKEDTHNGIDIGTWEFDGPKEFAMKLMDKFGQPDYIEKNPGTNETYSVTFMDIDGFDLVRIVDSNTNKLHPYPAKIYVEGYLYFKVPQDMVGKLKEASPTIMIDELNGYVVGKCASLTICAATIQFVIDAVNGDAPPTREEYDKRLKRIIDDKKTDPEIPWWENKLNEGTFHMEAKDLLEGNGLWANIHAKRERIKRGSGERMRKPGSKGAPTPSQMKRAQEESTLIPFLEKCWDGYRQAGMKKKGAKMVPNCVLEENMNEDDMKGMSVSSGHKRSVKQGAGMTKKGVAAYRRRNPGSKLGTAVTTPPSKLKAGSKAAGRRKSFCARSRSWTGPRGKAARRRWNC